MLSTLALIVPGIVEAQTQYATKGLEGVDIVVEAFDKGPELGFSRQDVESQVLVAIKRDLPKLPVGKQFTAYIYVRITAVPIAGGIAAYVEVELRRPMHILRENQTDTNMFSVSSTWDSGAVLSSHTSTIRARIFEEISEDLTQFAAIYYHQNP
jgi:hypothetical protein